MEFLSGEVFGFLLLEKLDFDASNITKQVTSLMV